MKVSAMTSGRVVVLYAWEHQFNPRVGKWSFFHYIALLNKIYKEKLVKFSKFRIGAGSLQELYYWLEFQWKNGCH